MLKPEVYHADYIASEAENSSFPVDVMPGHDYRNNLDAVARYIQRRPATELEVLTQDTVLEDFLDKNLATLLGTLVKVSASAALFKPVGQEDYRVTDTLTTTATLVDYGPYYELASDEEGARSGEKLDFFLMFCATAEDGTNGTLSVPCRKIKRIHFFLFDIDNLN